MDLVYQEMGPEEQELDWRVTRSVMADAVLMKTLEGAQASGEKHAVVAIVHDGELVETYVSPAAAVKKAYPFHAVEHAFDFYEPGTGVCLVIERNGRVVVSVNGLIGRQ